MPPALRFCVACLAFVLASFPDAAAAARGPKPLPMPPQETGFLNRKINLKGINYRFQVYLPEDWRRDDRKHWPILLFLHGRGERGSEGMWQTQIGLPAELRDHPDRWPFIVVLPQIPQTAHWTDPAMMDLAMATLDYEAAEFHADPDRTYLSGISLGGYGAWELARLYPHRWAAIAIASGGIFWSYEPSRWRDANTLPAQYAAAIGPIPIWLFHGTEDTTVATKQSEIMFDAFKAAGGHIRLWLYQGLPHDSWTRAFNEPDLPRWLLAHRNDPTQQHQPATAEKTLIPLHPPAIKLSGAIMDALSGQYREPNGHALLTISHQGDTMYEKDQYSAISEIAPESPGVFFYPHGSDSVRIVFERDRENHVTALTFRDDRREERWDRQPPTTK